MPWLGKDPHGNMRDLSRLRTIVEETFSSAALISWLDAPKEEKKELTLRLLQVLLDPRVKKQPQGQSLPRLDGISIPSELAQNPQMTICLVVSQLVREKPPAVPEGTWQMLQLGSEWRHGQPGYEAIDDPGKLFNFLAQYSRAVTSLKEVHDFLSLQTLGGRALTDVASAGSTTPSAKSTRHSLGQDDRKKIVGLEKQGVACQSLVATARHRPAHQSRVTVVAVWVMPERTVNSELIFMPTRIQPLPGWIPNLPTVRCNLQQASCAQGPKWESVRWSWLSCGVSVFGEQQAAHLREQNTHKTDR